MYEKKAFLAALVFVTLYTVGLIHTNHPGFFPWLRRRLRVGFNRVLNKLVKNFT